MNLQPRTQKIAGQKEFLRNSEGIEYKTAGGTIDASTFTEVAVDGYVKAGTAVAMNEEGLYVPYGVDSTGGGAGLVSHDIKLIADSNAIIGVLLNGHPLEDKCIGVTEDFKTETKGYLRFDA